MRKGKRARFSIIASLVVIAIIGTLAMTSLALYQQNQTIAKQSSRHQLTTTEDSAQLAAATTNWNIYKDSGYAAASGISIKYPVDWNISIPGVKTVGNNKQPTAIITERVIYLATAQSPKDEWNTCAATISADACGAAPGDKTINSKESMTNGYATYSAKMQTSSGNTYHVTVIRGNPTPDGIPFVEFTTTSTNQAALNTYADIMASATFSN